MTVIFQAKTCEGYIIKILSELLQNVVRIACLEVSTEGITMRMTDSQHQILIDMKLLKENFNVFEYTPKEPNHKLYLGINLGHLYKILKSIKKKDSIILSIDDTSPNVLHITVIPKEKNRVSKSTIHIQTIQHINIVLPQGYTNPILVSSSDFQRTLKEMNMIGGSLSISMSKYLANISCFTQGIYSKEVSFGEIDDEQPYTYQDFFDIELFTRILKITGLNKHIKLYSGDKHLPILLKSSVGTLGTIDIYIKSQDQIKKEIPS